MMYIYSFLVEGMDATFLHCLFNALVIYILLPQKSKHCENCKTNERTKCICVINNI